MKQEFISIAKQNFNAIEELFRIEAYFDKVVFDTEYSPAYQLQKFYPSVFQEIQGDMDTVFSYFMKENIEKGIQQALYRADLDIDRINNFHLTLRKNCHFEKLEEEKKNYYEILKYHVRAIGTEKGIHELNNQLNKLYGKS